MTSLTRLTRAVAARDLKGLSDAEVGHVLDAVRLLARRYKLFYCPADGLALGGHNELHGSYDDADGAIRRARRLLAVTPGGWARVVDSLDDRTVWSND